MAPENFTRLLTAIGIDLTVVQQQRFERYAAVLADWNQRMNLTAIDDVDGIYAKHFYDCVLAYRLANIYGPATLCDVGSGAGFPGIPLKIMDPSLKITLLEPTGKKCRFLQEVITQLELNDITVVNQRAEDYARANRETFDFVTARAVAPLNILLELCAPLVQVKGHFIALEGPSVAGELQEAQAAFKPLGLAVHKAYDARLDDGSQRLIIDFDKIGPGDPRYPRPYAQMKKKPIYKRKEDLYA